MKIAITGETGFVGKNLVPILQKEGHEILSFNSKNLDIRNPVELPSCDILYHLAANPKVYLARKEMIEDFKINSLGTLNVLDAALKAQIPKIIYASTVLVYKNLYSAEEDDPLDSTDVSGPYGVSKLAGEFYVKQYHYTHGIDYVILRPSGLYGPHMYKNPIIDMISGFLKDEPIKLFHDIESEFDFIYIEDVARAFAMSPQWRGETLNVSHGGSFKLKEVYETLAKIFTKKLPITHSGTKVKLCFKNDRLRKLGWSEKNSLEDGLRKTIDFFKKEGINVSK